MMKPGPKRDDVDKARKEIANVVQTFAEFRFQILGPRNLAVASIENTEHLKYRRPYKDAEIVATQKNTPTTSGKTKMDAVNAVG